jgi:hypothetical protein
MNKFEAFQARKAKSEKKFLIGGPLILLGVILGLLLGEVGIMIGVLLGLPGLVICIMGSSEFGKLNKQFKEEVLIDLISQYVDNGRFIPERGLNINRVYDTEFLKMADRYHTEDYLSGSIDGVQFESSDVKLEEKHVRHTKNGTQTYWETYFLGRIFVFEFNKSFDGYLQVLEGGRPVSRRKYSKIKMESVQFNKKFKTYTTNDHSAFYILTPHFMEKLQEFEQENNGRVYFSFIDNLLYIGINNNKDTFELKMFRKIDESLVDEFRRDLLVIKDVVHELKLNNNIFKK